MPLILEKILTHFPVPGPLFCHPSSRKPWAPATLWAGRTQGAPMRQAKRQPWKGARAETCPSTLKHKQEKKTFNKIYLVFHTFIFLL